MRYQTSYYSWETNQLSVDADLTNFHNQTANKTALYRFCIEQGLLSPEQIARTTFHRFIRKYKLLAKQESDQNKQRLAFSMKYANQLWQAATSPRTGTPHSSQDVRHSRRPHMLRIVQFLDRLQEHIFLRHNLQTF